MNETTAKGHDYDEARQLTAISLKQYADTTDQLTYLALPERDALIEEIARIVPAGNVPTMISMGLNHINGRVVPVHETRRNLALLLQGMQTFVDKMKYRAMFGGPAVVLAAYHMLLRLAGKDPIASFPEGTWQFYVEFGLREDSAHHTYETLGYHAALRREVLRPEPADMLAAWLLSSAWLLNHYDALLAAEWTERTRLPQIGRATDQPRLLERWLKTRPYAAEGDYLAARREAFNRYQEAALAGLDRRKRAELESSWNTPETAAKLAAYQRQMTIRAVLNPAEHSDVRAPLSQDQLAIGVIVNKRYYLVNLNDAAELGTARRVAAALLAHKSELPPASLDRTLVTSPRHEQLGLRRLLPPAVRDDLEQLRRAPIIINWDQVKRDSLTEIRSGQRGIGDHAMTIFRTPESFVFDLSHIFYDATGGMATAEIMTGLAANYARLIARHEATRAARPTSILAPTIFRPLNLIAPPEVTAAARKFHSPQEVSAENDQIKLSLIQDARRGLQKRVPTLRLTVNDLLLMYRAVFGPLYLPAKEITNALAALSAEPRTASAAAAALKAFDLARQINPALLIPVDATSISPHERIFATTFRNPFNTLYDHHRQTLLAFRAIEKEKSSEGVAQAREARREYLAVLNAFGEVMSRHKDVTMKGESLSNSTLKLLGGLPPAVQRLLDSLPAHFDLLNDAIKGQEVFSNVGQAAPGSSLSRFNTAKDDNEKKVMAWGVMTDANGVMHISLRDFRPHVGMLVAVNQRPLAQAITQDYLDKYAAGFNQFLEELIFIVRARSQID
jgi:hypothetical protein